jgi:hypothetical protein
MNAILVTPSSLISFHEKSVASTAPMHLFPSLLLLQLMILAVFVSLFPSVVAIRSTSPARTFRPSLTWPKNVLSVRSDGFGGLGSSASSVKWRPGLRARASFAADHFDALPLSCLRVIGVDSGASILGHFSFQASDENSLCSVILFLFEKDLFDLSLLEFVHFQYLSSPVIAEFVIAGFKFVGEWNASVWERICECPIQNVATTTSVHLKRFHTDLGEFSVPRKRSPRREKADQIARNILDRSGSDFF